MPSDNPHHTHTSFVPPPFDYRSFTKTLKVLLLYLLYIDESYLKQVHPFQLEKIKDQQKKWTVTEIIKQLDTISELDKDIKIGLKSIDDAVLSAIISVDKL